MVGFTCGTFDLLHTGHVLLLEECKKRCNFLIVGLQTDPTIDRLEKNFPIQSMFERFMQLKAVKYVDEIIPYDTEKDLLNLLKSLVPDVRFLGSDYKNANFTGKDFSEQKTVVYIDRFHDFSSTQLRNKIFNHKNGE